MFRLSAWFNLVLAFSNQSLETSSTSTSALIEGLSMILRDSCGNMDMVAIPSFGSFIPEKEDERVSIDLETGKRMLYPPQINLKFKPSAILRKRFNE